MKQKRHIFNVCGGLFFENGKPYWPDSLTVTMTKKEALSLVASLANQVKDDEEEMVEIGFSWKMINEGE